MFGLIRWTLLLIARRNWYAKLRWGYMGWLLVLLVLVYLFSRENSPEPLLTDLLQPVRLRNFLGRLSSPFLSSISLCCLPSRLPWRSERSPRRRLVAHCSIYSALHSCPDRSSWANGWGRSFR